MGSVKNISFNQFPKQSSDLGKVVNVCFNYDTSRLIEGIIVRDDAEEPNVTIIRLADGRYVLDTECQYTIKEKGSEGGNDGRLLS